MLSIFLVVLLQFNLSNGSIFQLLNQQSASKKPNVYATLNKVNDVLEKEIDGLLDNLPKKNNDQSHAIRFGGFDLSVTGTKKERVSKQDYNIQYKKNMQKRRLDKVKDDQKKRNAILKPPTGNVSEEKKKEQHMRAELANFQPLSEDAAIREVINRVNKYNTNDFEQAQRNVEKNPKNRKYLRELIKQIGIVNKIYQEAINLKIGKTAKAELEAVVKIGNRDLLDVYESVFGMIEHSEKEGSQQYRNALQQFTLPSKEMKQSSSDKAVLFQQAAIISEQYKKFVNDIGNQVGQEAGVQEVKLPSNLKKMQRIIEKTLLKGQGNANKVFDILRGMVVCDSMECIAKVIDMLASREDIIVTRVKE